MNIDLYKIRVKQTEDIIKEYESLKNLTFLYIGNSIVWINVKDHFSMDGEFPRMGILGKLNYNGGKCWNNYIIDKLNVLHKKVELWNYGIE